MTKPPPRKRARVPVQVQIDRELHHLAKLHRVNTSEDVSSLINRLLSQSLGKGRANPPA